MDGGAYNSAWRVPRKAQRDWIDFLSGFVRENVKQLADMSHAAGKEAMMFLATSGSAPNRTRTDSTNSAWTPWSVPSATAPPPA